MLEIVSRLRLFLGGLGRIRASAAASLGQPSSGCDQFDRVPTESMQQVGCVVTIQQAAATLVEHTHLSLPELYLYFYLYLYLHFVVYFFVYAYLYVCAHLYFVLYFYLQFQLIRPLILVLVIVLFTVYCILVTVYCLRSTFILPTYCSTYT